MGQLHGASQSSVQHICSIMGGGGGPGFLLVRLAGILHEGKNSRQTLVSTLQHGNVGSKK